MSKLIWIEENLPSLGLIFVRDLRDNMMRDEASSVRLGTTGTGIRPHYEVTFANGKTHLRNGLNHCHFKNADEFDPTNLSDPFTYFQITAAYHGRQRQKNGKS